MLFDFLLDSFSSSELERFLKFGGYDTVAAEANPNARRADYFFDVMLALDRRGLINTKFFEHLKEELPSRQAEIEFLMDVWLRADVTSSGGSIAATAAAQAASTNSVLIEVTINRDISSYSQGDQNRLIIAIKTFLPMSGDVRIIGIREGSVKLTVELSSEDAERLLRAVKAGEFATFDVCDAVIVQRRPAETSTRNSNVPSGEDASMRRLEFRKVLTVIRKMPAGRMREVMLFLAVGESGVETAELLGVTEPLVCDLRKKGVKYIREHV
jgi:hypothetical protein